MRAFPIVVLLMMTACGSPTQPTNATALIVQDFQGMGISLCGGVVGGVGTCGLNGRLRNVGAGCAQSISVTVTIRGTVVYTAPITVAGSVTRPNETVPYQIEIEVPWATNFSEMKIGATWAEIPCR